MRIPVNNQPVSLVVQNASTNGVRPLSYVFEVAADANFNNKVFVREGITPGDGRTSLRLPDPLASGRTYYWRAQALDGANTGPYSNTTVFDIYTPVVLDKVVLISPVNNETVSTLQPRFTVRNVGRSGPAGPITYEMQLADNSSLANALVWYFNETPNQSSIPAPVMLASSKQYFWRARATEQTTNGPWADVTGFKTPEPAPPPPPPGGGGGGGGGSCASRSVPQLILECRRAQFPGHMSAATIVTFLKLSASDLNAAGTGGDGPYGVLRKTFGNNCNGFSCDIICNSRGAGHDVLIDVEGAQTPIWGDPKPVPLACEIQ
jgi:hypothetical protein